MTCRSCMASSRAACVLGGVRLISSARITLANSGPSRKRNSRLPVERFSSMTSVPVMSAGIRSGVNWMRLNDRFSVRASVLIISVLARPGTPSSRQCPRLNRRDQQFLDDLGLADDDLPHLVADGVIGLIEFFDRLFDRRVMSRVGHSPCRLLIRRLVQDSPKSASAIDLGSSPGRVKRGTTREPCTKHQLYPPRRRPVKGSERKDEGGRMKDESDRAGRRPRLWLILHPHTFIAPHTGAGQGSFACSAKSSSNAVATWEGKGAERRIWRSTCVPIASSVADSLPVSSFVMKCRK